MQSPTAITDETVWLRSRDVSDAPKIGGEQYYETHDVTRRENATAADVPPVDASLCPVADEQQREAVRDIDREALEEEKLIGKWQLTGPRERIEELWPALLADAEAGVLWAVKVMTATGYAELPYDDYMIVVYTPNYFETDDVVRVRKHLRDEHGVTHELYYKPDIYTAKGIVAETAEEFDLPVPARYVA